MNGKNALPCANGIEFDEKGRENMDGETLRTLITCLSSIFIALSSNAFVFLSTRTNEKKNKNNSILEQQYNKVFTPIHKIVFFKSEYINKISAIERIISDNYELVADEIKDKFFECKQINGITTSFKNLIDACYKVSRNKLGYSNLKLKKEEKESTKKVISIYGVQKKSFVKKIFIFCLFMFIVYLIVLLDLLSDYGTISLNWVDYLPFFITGFAASVSVGFISKRYF